MFSQDSIDELRRRVRLVVAAKCRKLGNGIGQEADFTSRFLEALEGGLIDLKLSPEFANNLSPFPGYSAPDFEVIPRVLETQYRRSEENLSGADIMFSFRANVDGSEVNKSALVQAKLYRGDGEYYSIPGSTEKKQQLLAQCLRMQKISPNHSYVIVYCKLGIKFYTSTDVIRTIRADRTGLSYSGGSDFDEFMERIFQCTVGDKGLPQMGQPDFMRHLKSLEISDGFMIEVNPA